MLIGGTSFNPIAIKDMGYKKFKETYTGKLKGVSIDYAWVEITKLKVPKKK